MGIFCDAVVDALHSVRDPAVACGVHELAGYDLNALTDACHADLVVADSAHHTCSS